MSVLVYPANNEAFRLRGVVRFVCRSLIPTFSVAFIFFVALFFPPENYAQTIEDLKAGVVKIAATVEGQIRFGTGFIVTIKDDTAYILTASHVVEGASLTVHFYPKPDKPYPGKIKAMEGGDPKGLAVVLVRESLPKGIRPLTLASNVTIKGGEPVTLIGFPRFIGVPWAIAPGTITGQKGMDLIITGAAVQEGNSGGPILLNDGVVGVLTEIQRDFGFGVPSAIFQIALKGWGIQIERLSPSATEEGHALLDSYPPHQYLIAKGQGDLSEGRQVCRLTADVSARGELAKQIGVEIKEHFKRTIKKKDGSIPTEELDFLLQESTQKLLKDSRIVQRTVHDESGICTSIVVMPREHILRDFESTVDHGAGN